VAQPDTARPPRPRAGEQLELTIESLAHGGAGVARAEGFVVFVRGAVPGDRVLARVSKSKRSFAEADVVDLLEPSPERVDAFAPHPGAPWQVLPYERQLSEKQAQVADALERLGGFEQPPVEEMVPAVEPLRYRNKVEYSFGESDDCELVLGFHRPGRWDLIDPVGDDILASERVQEVRLAAAGWARREGLSTYDRSDHTGLLRNLVVREGRRTGDLQARLVTSPGELRVDELAAELPAGSLLWTRAAGVAETTRDGQTQIVTGREHL
jgi:23S rRNA (uracil1939-C5)-methyltransferase